MQKFQQQKTLHYQVFEKEKGPFEVVIGCKLQFLWLANGKEPLFLIVANPEIANNFQNWSEEKTASNLLLLWISDLLPCHWHIEKFDFLEIVIDAIFFPGPDLLNLKLVSMHFHITISTCSARAIFHPRCKWNPP